MIVRLTYQPEMVTPGCLSTVVILVFVCFITTQELMWTNLVGYTT
jgi:hypothetical protein